MSSIRHLLCVRLPKATARASAPLALLLALGTTGCPGDRAACGDGVATAPEECDGADLAGTFCLDLGFATGTLACATDCTFDTGACEVALCGDGFIGPGEDCDNAALGGNDCTTLGMGFDGGTLACDAGCSFDTSACTSPPVCGDDAVQAGEECDGIDLAGEDCTTLIPFSPGGTLGCAPDCTFDTTGCTPPPPADHCAPLAPGAPIVPGSLGACCEGARAGGATAECAPPLTCLNGYCTLLGCTSDFDCLDTVLPGDRSPFPDGTTFGCAVASAAVAPLSWCAPLGSGRRECTGPSGVACAAGETCVMAWDDADFFAGLCMTDVVQPAVIPDLASGDACHLSSARPCTTAADCRAGIEACDVTTGTCALVSPYSRYQCPGAEGAMEYVTPGVFAVAEAYSGPGGLFGWEGGCYAGPLGGPATCTAWCDPGAPACGAGETCARFDFFSETGDAGMCVAAECRHAYGPIPATDTANIAGLTVVTAPACAVDAECAAFNPGAGGGRCLDTDADGAGDMCQFIDRVTACPAGSTCGRPVWSSFFDQGVPAMDSLGRTDLDTYAIHCVPEVLLATGGLGDPCVDGQECLSGICTRGDLYDPALTAAVATSGTCTAVCANDATCAAGGASGDTCIAYGLFGGGSTMTWPLCVPFDVLSGQAYCARDGDCGAGLACAVLSFRSARGLCDAPEGVLADQAPDGTPVTDDQPNGAACRDDVNRCLPGDDGVESSTAFGARTGACAGDDVLAADATNCRSGLCLDGDDLTGGGADGDRLCSAVCTSNADCAGPQVCTSALLHDNSTADPADDTTLGLCRPLVPVAAADRCNDTAIEATNDADCAALFPALPGVACDDGLGASPAFMTEAAGGACYAPAGTVGAPCMVDAECNLGGRCVPDNGSADPALTFPGGYCVMDGCAYDAATGVGTAADCPAGFDAGTGDTTTACVKVDAVGLCLKSCAGDGDCRADYTCQELLAGTGVLACWPAGM